MFLSVLKTSILTDEVSQEQAGRALGGPRGKMMMLPDRLSSPAPSAPLPMPLFTFYFISSLRYALFCHFFHILPYFYPSDIARLPPAFLVLGTSSRSHFISACRDPHTCSNVSPQLRCTVCDQLSSNRVCLGITGRAQKHGEYAVKTKCVFQQETS